VTDIAIIAAVLLAYALVSRRLESTLLTAPMLFVAAGMALGPHGLDAVGLELTHGAGLVVAEVTLAIVLFTDAARIDLRVLRRGAGPPGRLLGIGMPLTIGLGVAAGAVLLTDIDVWEAAIAAAVLAPTDAALGQVVVSSERVPRRVRQALNVESGLNDGLTVPFLVLFIALAANDVVGGREWASFALEQVGYGVATGIVVGAGGALLVGRASERGLMTGSAEQLAVLAMAILAWAGADEIGGNGFIAAFVGGMAAGRITASSGERILEFAENEGHMLNLTVFFIFGAAVLEYLEAATWEVVVFALLSLTLVRMLPVAVSLLGTGLRPVTVAFMGWFGPRGLASIILALVVVEEEPELPGLDIVLAAVAVTVLASVFAHGITARPLAAAYGRRVDDLPPGAPELAEVPELPLRRPLADAASEDDGGSDGHQRERL
jgi:NhaP-type Na+/H+ or K+/H+ antiporter